jgi:hypothetical protein
LSSASRNTVDLAIGGRKGGELILQKEKATSHDVPRKGGQLTVNTLETAVLTTERIRGWPIELKTLQRHIHTLVTLKETEAPVVSVYLNPQQDPAELREFTKSRVGLLMKSLSQDHLRHFQRATDRIGRFLSHGLRGKPQGAAIFARAGTRPFFLALQFGVPLPNVITVASHPSVYHLVELKDVYHRYVVVVLNDQGARILEVHGGAVT